jgi:hypothetical protein
MWSRATVGVGRDKWPSLVHIPPAGVVQLHLASWLFSRTTQAVNRPGIPGGSGVTRGGSGYAVGVTGSAWGWASSQAGQELKSVAEAVIQVEAPVAGQVGVRSWLEAVGVQMGGQAVKVLHEDAGVGLAGRAEVVLHPKVQLQRRPGTRPRRGPPAPAAWRPRPGRARRRRRPARRLRRRAACRAARGGTRTLAAGARSCRPSPCRSRRWRLDGRRRPPATQQVPAGRAGPQGRAGSGPTKEAAHFGLQGGLQHQADAQAGDLLRDLGERLVAGEQLIDLAADTGQQAIGSQPRAWASPLELVARWNPRPCSLDPEPQTRLGRGWP